MMAAGEGVLIGNAFAGDYRNLSVFVMEPPLITITKYQ